MPRAEPVESKLEPHSQWILVRLEDQLANKSAGGIHLPDVSERPYRNGRIVRIGPGVLVASQVPMYAACGSTNNDLRSGWKEGDVVRFTVVGLDRDEIDGETFYWITPAHIRCRVSD